jgi:hypothetical protein
MHAIEHAAGCGCPSGSGWSPVQACEPTLACEPFTGPLADARQCGPDELGTGRSQRSERRAGGCFRARAPRPSRLHAHARTPHQLTLQARAVAATYRPREGGGRHAPAGRLPALALERQGYRSCLLTGSPMTRYLLPARPPISMVAAGHAGRSARDDVHWAHSSGSPHTRKAGFRYWMHLHPAQCVKKCVKQCVKRQTASPSHRRVAPRLFPCWPSLPSHPRDRNQSINIPSSRSLLHPSYLFLSWAAPGRAAAWLVSGCRCIRVPG